MNKTRVVCLCLGFMVIALTVSAALIDSQKQTYLDDMRSLAADFDSLRARSLEMSQKWNSLGFTSGGDNEFTQLDIDGPTGEYPFAGLSVAELTACVTTVNGFETWYDTGHDDNMRKIRP